MAPAGGHRSVSTQEHQFAVSNTTVNKFLGGRQPSWMTNAKPVKPTPRPPNQPPKQPLPELLPPRRSSSSSSRPAPPPHSQQQKRPSVVPAAAAATASNSSHLPPPQPQPTSVAATNNTITTPLTTSPTVLPSPAPSEEPSPAVSAAPEVLNSSSSGSFNVNPQACEPTAFAPAIETRPPLAYAIEIIDHDTPNFSQAAYSGNPSLSSGPAAPTETDAGTHMLQAPSLASGAVSTAAAPVSVAPAITLPTPPTPSAPTFSPPMTAPSPFTGAGPEPQAKRRRLGSDAGVAFLQSLNASVILEQQVHQNGGERALDMNVEKPRYQLLRDACLDGDLFFIALHQMFCSWSLNNASAHDLCIEGLHETSQVDNAFGLMGTILKSNAKLRPEHAHFFSNFPRPLWIMRNNYAEYSRKINEVLNFLMRMSQQWQVVNFSHGQMKYPLLMDELIGTFGLFSPILQTIVFRASRRSLGVTDGVVGAQMDELFRHDQLTRRRPNGEFVAGGRDLSREPNNQALIQRYQSLIAQAVVSVQMSPRPTPGAIPQQQYHNSPPQPYAPSPPMNRQPQPLPQAQQQPPPNGHTASNTRYAQGSGMSSTPPNHSPLVRNGHSSNNMIHTQGPAVPSIPSNSGQPVRNGQAPNSMRYPQGPGVAPTRPSTRQGVQQLPALHSGASPQANNFAFAPQIATHPYQLPSAQAAELQNSPNVPTSTANFSNTSFVQSPGTAPGQAVQFQGQQVSPFPKTLPSPQALPGYPQSLPGRRASQQFAPVPSTRSPQMQNLVNSPMQRNASPSGTPNMAGQVPVMQQPPGPSTLPSSLPGGVSHQHRLPRPSALSSARSAQNLMAPNSPFNNPENRTAATPATPATPGHFAVNNQLLQMLSQARPSLVQQQSPRQTNNRATNGGRPINFIDASQYPHDPYERKSLEMSLHQAHLRSPRRVFNANSSASDPDEKHYQAVKTLALQPMPIPQRASLYTLKFTVSDEDYRRISVDAPLFQDSWPVNLFSDGSIRLRLRTCFLKSNSEISENTWVLAETNWPEQIFIQLNNRPLTLRRKQHHAKDQPVEIGSFVMPGLNVLKVSVPMARAFPKDMNPFIAVEVVETLSHHSIITLPNLVTPLPASETRGIVQRRLGASNQGDDEIAIASTDLSINLADPFSYTMWQTPVRGATCTHLECFDLETWLTTRPTKKSCVCRPRKQGEKQSECKSCPKEPSQVDKWKCPHCQGDARPYSLRIDSFMAEVRDSLTKRNLLNVKEIKVLPDGSWNPVIPDDDSDLESDEEMNAVRAISNSSARSGQKRPAAAVEVIYLDDD